MQLAFEKGDRVCVFLAEFLVKLDRQTGREDLDVLLAHLAHVDQEVAVLGLDWMRKDFVIQLIGFKVVCLHEVHWDDVQLDVMLLDS